MILAADPGEFAAFWGGLLGREREDLILLPEEDGRPPDVDHSVLVASRATSSAGSSTRHS